MGHIYDSAGKNLQSGIAQELSEKEDIVLLCGHYEGIDERVLEMIVDDYMSIGDFVLTGGELPAMAIVDAVSRLVPGVLNNEDSAEIETFITICLVSAVYQTS